MTRIHCSRSPSYRRPERQLVAVNSTNGGWILRTLADLHRDTATRTNSEVSLPSGRTVREPQLMTRVAVMRPNDQEGWRTEGVAICHFGGPYLSLS